jgi:hypothetical protein
METIDKWVAYWRGMEFVLYFEGLSGPNFAGHGSLSVGLWIRYCVTNPQEVLIPTEFYSSVAVPGKSRDLRWRHGAPAAHRSPSPAKSGRGSKL